MQHLSIRELAKTLGVSPTEVSRKMTALGIQGHPQGKGKPTLLDPDDQGAIARALHKAAPVEGLVVEAVPSTSLAIVDPFTGAGAGAWNPAAALAIVDRRAAADHLATDAHSLISAAALANNKAINAAAGAADQLGDQLGSLLAHRTIAAAESRRQTILGDYLASQGVEVGESQGGRAA